MRIADAVQLLNRFKDNGLITNFALDHFNGPQTLPYAAYYQLDSNPFSADNINYFDEPVIAVELYTARVDFALTEQIETSLRAGGFYHEKLRPAWEPTQKYYMTVFYIA